MKKKILLGNELINLLCEDIRRAHEANQILNDGIQRARYHIPINIYRDPIDKILEDTLHKSWRVK